MLVDAEGGASSNLPKPTPLLKVMAKFWPETDAPANIP